MIRLRRRLPGILLVVSGLLLMLGTTTSAATGTHTVPFTAHLVTINQAPTLCDSAHICIALNGTGRATRLGALTEVGQVKIDLLSQPDPSNPACQSNVRTMLLTAANGDQLALLITGVNCDTGATSGITGISHDTWVVVGGTGRFSGATGSGIETVHINLPASTAWTEMRGTLTMPNGS